jgi:hypothetical protein
VAIVAVLLAGLLSAACDKGPTAPTPGSPIAPSVPSTTTHLSFTSDRASAVGQGQSRAYTLQNATFQPMMGFDGGYLSVVVRPTDPSDSSSSWSAMMMAPVGRTLSPGTYSAIPGGSFETYLFDFSGGGRSCGSGTTSTLTISEIVVSGSTLQRLRSTFTVYCGGSATVRGELVVLADPWR